MISFDENLKKVSHTITIFAANILVPCIYTGTYVCHIARIRVTVAAWQSEV